MGNTLNTNRRGVTSVNGQTGDVVLGKYHKYTSRWNQKDAQMTRENDSAAITTDTKNFGHFGSVNPNYDNPFDNIYPWSGRRLCNIDIEVYMTLKAPQTLKACVVAWEGDPDFSYEHKYGVWVYTPECWGKDYIDGEDRLFEVSDADIPGENYNYYPEDIGGRWHGVKVNLEVGGSAKDILLPLANDMPAACYTVTTMHTQAKAYGATLDSIYSIDKDALLYVVEYARTNIQTAIGMGVSSMYHAGNVHPVSVDGNVVTVLASDSRAVMVGSIIGFQSGSGDTCNLGRYEVTNIETAGVNNVLTLKGTLNTGISMESFWGLFGKINTPDEEIGSKSGYIGTDVMSIAYYRGKELYANMYLYTLGAYREQGTNHVWIAKDIYDADDADALNKEKHIDTGILLSTGPDGSNSSGYIKTLGRVNGLSFPPFCTSVGGDSEKPVGDRFFGREITYQNTVLHIGGDASNAYFCGLWCAQIAEGNSASWWARSSRPVLLPPR